MRATVRAAVLVALLSVTLPGLAEDSGPPEKVEMPAPWLDAEDVSVHCVETTCNTYFLTCKATGQFVVVDPGTGILPWIRVWSEAGHEFAGIWITHEHWDHVNGLGEVIEEKKVPIHAHQKAKEEVERLRKHWAEQEFGVDIPMPPAVPDVLVPDGGAVTVGKMTLKALHIPGHSPGSNSFLLPGRLLFAGDVLFKGSVGRTDFEGCDRVLFTKGLSAKLWDLPDGVVVFPGHMEKTTIGEEKANNWLFQDYVREARGEKPVPRPWMGVGIDREFEKPGIRLTEVVEGSPAEAAKLLPGDVITHFGDHEIQTIQDFIPALRSKKIGDTVELTVIRGEETIKLPFRVGSRPVPK